MAQYTKGIHGDASTEESLNKYLNPAQHFAHTTSMVEDTFSNQDVNALINAVILALGGTGAVYALPNKK